METIRVNLDARSYDIIIQTGALSRVGEWMARFPIAPRTLVIMDENTAELFGAPALESMKAAGFDPVSAVITPGEASKSLPVADGLYETSIRAGLDRNCSVVALGGGVVGDLAGFVAATYQRGVPFLQIPTTLLSQVDSSVGGKVAVNHALGKNLIGAFYQPRGVLIDPETLVSLPQREFASGMAEVIKYGLICDEPFLTWLEEHVDALRALDQVALTEAISRSCAAKALVVNADERESGVRATLNLGHTFGHAIETHMGYGVWLHGEAVAAGTVMALEMSQRLGWISAQERDRGIRLFQRAGLPVIPPTEMTEADFLEHMAIDKKVIDGRLRLVLLRHIGEAVVTDDYPKEILQATLGADYRALAQLKG